MQTSVEINNRDVKVIDQYHCLNCGSKHFRLLRVEEFCKFWIVQCVDCEEINEDMEIIFH